MTRMRLFPASATEGCNAWLCDRSKSMTRQIIFRAVLGTALLSECMAI